MRGQMRSAARGAMASQFAPVGSSAPAAPVLPQSGSLVARWSADAIAPQADNTALAAWADSVGGISAAQGTGVNQPKYRTASLGGKPGVQFDGAQWLSIATPGAVRTAIDSRIYSVVIVATNVAATGYGCLFGSSEGGNSQLYIANGTSAGRFDANVINLCVPWAAQAPMLVLGATSTMPYTMGSGAALERIYMQGGCVASSFAAPPVSSGSGGSFAIGARSSLGSLPVKAVIYEVMVWSTQLTPSDLMRVQAYICAKYSQATPWSSASKVVVFDGDSLTAGVGAGGALNSYPNKSAQSLGLSYGQWTMVAVGGMRLDNMLAKLGEWSEISTITAKPVRVAADEYYNVKASSAATIAGYAAAYASAVRALPNTKLIFGTSTGHNTDPDATRASYNTLIDGSPSTYGDVIVSLHTDTSIGTSGAYAANSATYWSDGVHLNGAGYTIKAALMTAGITAAA